MKERMKQILDNYHHYNDDNMAKLALGLDNDIEYDALVLAPAFSPYKLKMDKTCNVQTLQEGAYNAGYLVEKDGMKIAWVKMGSSEGNLIDHLCICTELKFKKMIFVGAVGALKESYELGDICMPSYSVAGGNATTYFKESMHDYVPFEKVYPDISYTDKVIRLGRELGCPIKKAGVFCTPSVALEYVHLPEICALGVDLIEMETASFYRIADLLEIPAAALLVVSDNVTNCTALIGRTEEQEAKYNEGRRVLLPRMIWAVTAME